MTKKRVKICFLVILVIALNSAKGIGMGVVLAALQIHLVAGVKGR